MRGLLIGFCCVAILSGCSKPSINDERTDPLFVEGCEFLKDNRVDLALKSFLAEIKQRDLAPESHFEAGCIYLYNVKNPYYAVYHFNECLACADFVKLSHDQCVIRELIDTARKNSITGMPGNISDDSNRDKLVEVLRMTRDENAFLKKKIKSYEDRLNVLVNQQQNTASQSKSNIVNDNTRQPSQNTHTVAVSQDAVVGQRTYVVQSGDSLSKISTKMYGTSRHWKKISDANRGILKNKTKLSVGQKLVIP